MEISEMTASQLDKIRKQVEKKDKLLQEVYQIDEKLHKIQEEIRNRSGFKQTYNYSYNHSFKEKRLPRGYLTKGILEVIRRSGDHGITVDQIAHKIGVSKTKVFVWISQNRNRYRLIQVAKKTYKIKNEA